MLRGDPYPEGLGSGAKPQRGVELCRFAVDPGRDRAVGADLKRRCRPLVDALLRAAGWVFAGDGDAERSSVKPGACAGPEDSAEPVGVV